MIAKIFEAKLTRVTQLSQSQQPTNSTLRAPTEQQPSQVDLNKQGMIRTVKDAHLVYKRKDQNNQYTELWVYKRDSGKKNSTAPFDAIIAGTDIEKGHTMSPDGEQSIRTWEVGPVSNTVCFVEIMGLAN